MIIRPGIELRSPDIQRNPYPHYKFLRENYRVCLLEDGQYALTRWDDVVYALSRADLFSSGIAAISAAEWLPPDCRRDVFILSMDPPEHTEYRSLVNRAFVGEVIQNLIPVMRGNAQKYVERIRALPGAEFVSEFAYPYIDSIIGRLTVAGESQSLAEIKQNVELRELFTPEKPANEFAQLAEASMRAQNRHFDAIFSDRRSNPKDDLATALLNARVQGRALSDKELRNALDLFTSAGYHSTAQFLAMIVRYLARNPDVFLRLKNTPTDVPAFIEELLRFDGPTHRLIRITTQDIQFDDLVIPKGALVSVLIASANHDPAQFRDPDIFNMERPNNKRHLQFGGGVHVCIGAALARMELRVALEEIVSACTEVNCTPDAELEFTGTMSTRGLRNLGVWFK